MRKILSILLLGVAFGVAGVILHECGHYLTALALGFSPHIHFARTTVSSADTPAANFLVTAAGPGVNALLILAGLIWLWYLRHNRQQEPATMIDWVASMPALYAARWLLGLHRPSAYPGSYDEATLSIMAGLPRWGLPYFLGAVALVMFAWVIRLHPPGRRLFPFCAAAAGCYLGLVLWLKVLGPRVLP